MKKIDKLPYCYDDKSTKINLSLMAIKLIIIHLKKHDVNTLKLNYLVNELLHQNSVSKMNENETDYYIELLKNAIESSALSEVGLEKSNMYELLENKTQIVALDQNLQIINDNIIRDDDIITPPKTIFLICDCNKKQDNYFFCGKCDTVSCEGCLLNHGVCCKKSQNIIKIENEQKKCDVCNNNGIYIYGVDNMCKHGFCLDCIRKYKKKHKFRYILKNGSKKAKCPICSKITKKSRCKWINLKYL